MLPSRLPTFTLFTALLVALAAPAAADVSPLLAQRSEHARMIKRYSSPFAKLSQRRGLGDIFGLPDHDNGSTDGGVVNAAPDPNAGSSTSGASTSAAPTQSSPSGPLGGLGDIFGDPHSSSSSASDTGSLSSSSSTVPSSTSLSTSTSTPAPPTTTAKITSSDEATSATSTTPASQSTVWIDDDSQAQQDKEKVDRGSTLSRIPPHVRTILIAIAASIAGVAIIWTIVRKWKFRSSRSFQDRLAPIDWQPDADKEKNTLPVSGGAMADAASDNASIRRNMFAPDNASLAPPAHDFTAVPGRTASPFAPQQQNLYRAPSNGSGRGGYDPARGY